MRSGAPTLFFCLLLSLPAFSARGEEAAKPVEAAKGLEFFESKIRPLLVDACVDCHGPKKQKGDLRLDSRAGWVKGGASGAVIVPGKPDDSLLITAVRYWDKELQMPPKHALEIPEVNDLIAWVKLGAPDPRDTAPEAEALKKTVSSIDFEKGRTHWSFQPVGSPAPPAVQDQAWVRNEVDQFTLARMELAAVKPAPDAERHALLRRVTYDLTGLPPTPAEIGAFIQDTSPEAYARVVDRLLASPRYGERWGRHWLDVVRYADTCGNASDYPVPQAYLYRDYVLQAFNEDMPFDRFIREQIAGDLLPFANEVERQQHIVATGYLAMARTFGGGNGEPHLTMDDAIDNTGRAFLGLSIGCARCHDHKFDPISSQDYYAIYGILNSTTFPHAGSEGKSRPERLVPLVPKGESDAADAEREKQVAAIDEEIKAANAVKAEVLKEPESPEKKEHSEAASKVQAELTAKKKALKDIPLYRLAYAVSEAPAPANAKLQVRGDPKRLGEEVPRGFLTVLGGQTLPANEHGSGRRELAQWIADAANPLTARVMANRIWEYHFGRGLVATPNDFGKRGQAPTHPELLDFLARHFVEKGWSMKEMHRLLVLSHTYQQATDGGDAKDPANALWSRADRHRLDAEEIWDSLLAVSGDLDLEPGGAHPFPAVPTWSFTQHHQFFALYDTKHRAVYQMQQRLRKHPFFALFDGADTNSSTAVRTAGVTALQSLFAMNDKFAHETADHFAKALMKRFPENGDDAKRTELAFLTLYGRPPDPEEIALFLPYLTELRSAKRSMSVGQSWESLARVLLSANEFLYLD